MQTYQLMVAMGGEYAERGYQGQVDAYRDAKQYDKATQVAQQAAHAMPKDKSRPVDAGRAAGRHRSMRRKASSWPRRNSMATRRRSRSTPGVGTDVHPATTLEGSLRRDRRRRRSFRPKAGQSRQLGASGPIPVTQDDKIYIYFLRGALDERQKHYDSAEEQFRKILAIDSNNSMTLNYLGYMLGDRGVKLDDALAMVQKAVQLDPQNGAYLDSLGWVYFKMGQYRAGRSQPAQGQRAYRTGPAVHDHLGEFTKRLAGCGWPLAQWEQSLAEYARTVPADAETSDVNKVQKKLR